MTGKEARELTEVREKEYQNNIPSEVQTYINTKILSTIEYAIKEKKYIIQGKEFRLDFIREDEFCNDAFIKEFERQINVLGFKVVIYAFRISIFW